MAILLIADILLISKRIRGDIKVIAYGAKIPSLKKSKYAERWEAVKKRIEEGSVSSGKMAVIEADNMLGEVLKEIGYSGKDTNERISQVKAGQLAGIEELTEARRIYKGISEDPSYKIGVDKIKETIGAYEKVFRGLELLE